jgi:hypothetical protein
MKVTLGKNTLSRAKALMKQPYETSGHMDIGADGSVEHMTENHKMRVLSLLPADYEINYHTHPPDYESIYPDHPSITDYQFCLFVIGFTREVQAHLIFTPRYIYVIQALPELFSMVSTEAKYDDAAARASDLYDQCIASNPNRDSTSFEKAWMRAAKKLGLNVTRYGDTGDPYTREGITLDIVPIEPGPWAWVRPAVAGLTIAGAAAAAVYAYNRKS